MQNDIKVLVLLGGDSPEREVSIRSGKAVISALEAAEYDVISYDPKDGVEGLRKICSESDVIFPILHGINGEDGVIQAQLEAFKKPYLGSDALISKICFDKDKTHEILGRNGIRMPRYSLVTEKDTDDLLFKKPFVLKPVEGGSSVDTLVARESNQSKLDSALKLLKKYKTMILEELIEGQEITVPVLGKKALPVIAIIPPKNGEFDYENKYNGATQEICPVPEELVSKIKQTEAQELALSVHELLGARHLSRIDMFVKDNGELIVLELNTMPGMTNQSLYPNSAKVAGYSMPELVREFIDLITVDGN